MRQVLVFGLVSGLVLFCCFAGCKEEASNQDEAQSMKEALEEMCSIPDELVDEPQKIGPYLEERIEHPGARTLLATLDSPEDLKVVLEEHGLDPERCALVGIGAETP